MGGEKLSDGSDVARIETTIDHMGEDVTKLHTKVDDLVDGLNTFKLEVTRGFGDMNGAVDRVDLKVVHHSSDTERRFGEHADDIDEAKKAATDAKDSCTQPSRAQQAGVLGGAGAAGGIVTAFLNWLSSHLSGGAPGAS